MNKLLLISAYLAISACSTINFVNGPQMDKTVDREQWHHIAFLQLIEVSRPLDISYNCGQQQWDTVTVEKSFFNGLAEVSWPAISIYSPMTIIYKCRDSID